MARFVVTRAPGQAWASDTPTRQQAGWEPHAEFMDALADERFVAFGGPAGNDDRVVLIVDAPDEKTVRERLALDPWTVDGLLSTVAVDQWTIWLGAEERVGLGRPGSLYLVSYAPGPAWDRGRPRREQTGWDAHAAFMDELAAQGDVVLGGPLDEQRALVVLQGESESGVRARLETDPWAGGTLTIESVKRWALWLPPRPTAANHST